jgi:hypothetical protein
LIVKEENEKGEGMKIVMVHYPCPSGEAGEETPAELLGCADKALGLREWIEDQGHELVVTTDTECDELYEHLKDAEVLIATPFWPVYATKEVLDQAPNLRLCLLAGVGSAVNNHGEFGRWGFVEISDPWDAQNTIRGVLSSSQPAYAS